MMALVKSLMLIIATTLQILCITPPSGIRPVKATERQQGGWGESAVLIYNSIGAMIAKWIYLAAVLYECASIIALTYTDTVVGNGMLRLLFLTQGERELAPLGVAITPRFILSFLVATAGLSFRLSAFSELGSSFTFELSKREDHKLVTTGPYAIVRHPGYTGLIAGHPAYFVLLTDKQSALMHSAAVNTPVGRMVLYLWALNLFMTSALLVPRVGVEDRIMKREFRKEWAEWAKRVPHKLIPGIY